MASNYIILSSTSLLDLEEQVKVALTDGYQPVGGVTVAADRRKGHPIYLQALWKAS